MNTPSLPARNMEHRAVGEEEYVRSVLKRYAVETGPDARPPKTARRLIPDLEAWAGDMLLPPGIRVTGAGARAAAVRTDGDTDLMIPLRKDAGDIRSIYRSLWRLADERRWTHWSRVVSRRVALDDVIIDLVPVLVDPDADCPHTIYFVDRDATTQTNLDLHVQLAEKADCAEVVQLVKIWRDVQGLELPSLHLELLTYEALDGDRTGTLVDRFRKVLRHIDGPRVLDPMPDPANPENVVSAGASREQKERAVDRARWSVNEAHLTEVLR